MLDTWATCILGTAVFVVAVKVAELALLPYPRKIGYRDDLAALALLVVFVVWGLVAIGG